MTKKITQLIKLTLKVMGRSTMEISKLTKATYSMLAASADADRRRLNNLIYINH